MGFQLGLMIALIGLGSFIYQLFSISLIGIVGHPEIDARAWIIPLAAMALGDFLSSADANSTQAQ